MARYDYRRRVELAEQRLRAAGIARTPGRDAYKQWQRLDEASRARAVASQLRADPNYRPGGSRARLTAEVRGRRRAGPLRQVSTPAGDILYTGNQQVVIDTLRAAVRDGKRFAFKANFLTPEGEPRTKIVDGGAEVESVLNTAMQLSPGEMAGARGQRPLPVDTHTAAGRRSRPGVELRIGNTPGTVHPRGLDPLEVLQLIRAMGGDVWGALYLLWVFEVSP